MIRNCVGLLLLFTCNVAVASNTPIEILPTWHGLDHVPGGRVTAIVQNNFDVSIYRSITAQVIHDDAGKPDHIVVHLYSRETRTYEIAMVKIDAEYTVQQVIEDHEPDKWLFKNQAHHRTPPICPDTEIQFLSIAPMTKTNQDMAESERDYADEVANAAIDNGYKTKTLYGNEATTQNILHYMVCPNLLGIFYDGDAGKHSVKTHGGNLSYLDVDTYLSGRLGKVTNIWLACNAFQEPLLGAMKRTGAQVYAAGKNILQGTQSDKAAVCAMKAAIEGQPMKAAFDNCLKQDYEHNIWGWHSGGSDRFGQ